MPKQQDLQFIYRLHPEWDKKTVKVKKAGGQTNRNYIVTFKEKKFFVRLPWERGDVVNRRAEGRNITALSRNKKLRAILPRYYSYIFNKKNILAPEKKELIEVPEGTMVTEFIEGKEFTMGDFRQKKHQKTLAQMFCTFHKSGVRFANSYSVFRDEIRKYRKKARALPLKRFLDRKTISQLLVLESKAERELSSLQKGISTHNDFIFQNFLIGKDKKIYLLDFEYAGLNKKGGIPYDFGFLFADNLFRKPKMTKALFEQFLWIADRAYQKKLDREQIYWSAIAATLVQVWWGILRYFSVPIKERPYFKDYVTRRIQGIGKIFNDLKKE